MALDILGYRDKHKDYYGDSPLEDVAKDAYTRGGYDKKYPDYNAWKKDSGIDVDIEEDRRLRNPTFEDKLRSAVEKPKSDGNIVKSFLQGGAEGLTTELPSMVGGAIQFAGSHLPFDGLENAGKSLKDWAEEKRKDLYGPEVERTGLDRIVYEGTKMLAPSIIPGGVVGTAARVVKGVNALSKAGKIAEATAAAKSATNIAGGSVAALFGLSQAQQTKDTAEQAGVEAGMAPYLTGAIEAAGEFLGTKYLAKLFGLDEAEVLKKGATQFVTDLIKTIGVEVGTEIGQAGGESAVEKYSGIRPNANPIMEAVDVIGPTIFMTLLTGGMAGAANKLRSADPEEKAAAQYIEKLKAGAMVSMAINEGMKNGQYEGQPFTQDNALETIRAAQDKGIFDTDDLDRFKDKYPQLRDGLNGVIVESLTKKVGETIKQIPWQDFTLKGEPYQEGVTVGEPYSGEILRPVRPAKPEPAIDAEFSSVRKIEAPKREETKLLPGGQGFELSETNQDEITTLQERIQKVQSFLDKNEKHKGGVKYQQIVDRLDADKVRLSELTGGDQNGTLQTETEIENVAPATPEIVEPGAKAPEDNVKTNWGDQTIPDIQSKIDAGETLSDTELNKAGYFKNLSSKQNPDIPWEISKPWESKTWSNGSDHVVDTAIKYSEEVGHTDAIDTALEKATAAIDSLKTSIAEREDNKKAIISEGRSVTERFNESLQSQKDQLAKFESAKEKLAKAQLPAPLSQTDAATVGVTKDEAKSGESLNNQALVTEARKYKTAEEFVNGHTNAVRQGNIEKGGAYFATEGSSTYYDVANEGVSQYNISETKLVQSGTPEMRTVLENAKKLKNTPEELQRINEALKADNTADNFVNYMLFDEVPSIKKSAEQLKYDGVKIWENDDVANPSSVFIWNTDKIKTKADLTSIWNKAQEAPAAGQAAGEPWEMSRADYVRAGGLKMKGRAAEHKKAVQQAIAEGKITKHPDYPELGKGTKAVKGGVTESNPVEKFIKESLSDRAKEIGSLTKKANEYRLKGNEEIARILEGQIRDYQSVPEKDFADHVRKNPDYYMKSNIDPFLKYKNKEVNLATTKNKPKEAPNEKKTETLLNDEEEPKEIFIRAAEKKDLGRVQKSLKAIPDKFGYEKVYKRGGGKTLRGFYYVKVKVKEVKPEKQAPAPSGAENLVTFLTRAGKVRLGEEFQDKTGDAWSRTHGFRSKDRSREMGDIAGVTSKNGKHAMDEAADLANAEGFRDKNGNKFTDRTLFETLADGEGRNILHPDHEERIIESYLRGKQNEWADEQVRQLEEAKVSTGEIEENHGDFIARSEEILGLEGYSPEEVRRYASDYLDEITETLSLKKYLDENPDRRIDAKLREELNGLDHKQILDLLAQKHEQLKTDSLTNLKSKEAYVNSDKLSYQAVIDLDGLKYINDTFGHQKGDEYLKKFGDAITGAGGASEAYRTGGDEFALQGNTPEELSAIVNKAKEILKTDPVTIDGKEFNVDFSHGIAEKSEEKGGQLDALVDADKEMYKDKAERKAVGAAARGEAPKTEKTKAGDQAAIPGASAAETFSLNNPETEWSKHLSEQTTPKNADMFGEGAESKPEIKEWQDITELDAQIRTIKEPVKDSKYWTVEIGVQESLGEQGGDILTWEYDAKPTLDEIKKDILDHYKKEKIEINTEVGIGIVAKTGRDEMREEAIDKVLENKPTTDSIDGFIKDLNPMQRGKVIAALNKQTRQDGIVRTAKEHVEKLIADGGTVATYEEDVIKPLSRMQDFRADQKTQDAHAKKVKEAGKKTVYTVDGWEMGKIAYDYAKYLLDKKAQPPATPGATADSGEELKYNKRNRIKTGITWEDIKDKNTALKVKETNKQNVYPKPDYAQMVDDGMEPMIAHIVKQVYDSIPVAPTTSKTLTDELMQRYITAVNRVMDGTSQWANDKGAIAAWAGKQARYAGAALGKVTNLTDLAQSNKSLLDIVYPEGYKTYIDEVRILDGNKVLKALQPGYEQGKKAMKEIKIGWPGKLESWQKQGYAIVERKDVKIPDGWMDADRKPTYPTQINNRSFGERYKTKEEAQASIDEMKPFILTDKYSRPIGQFNTIEEAQESAREKVKRENKPTINEKGISVQAAVRTGTQRRESGENITTDRLRETFGFKGVNFGNWMKGNTNEAERQLHLNHAYDSFMDLAEILDVPPKAMSLNGMLGIAIGAQGSGKNAAHFVPGVNEINLTRTAGAGAMAHEWGHALDHYFANQAGLGSAQHPYLTENKPQGGTIRPEIVEIFKKIVHSMNKKTIDITPEEQADQLSARKEDSKKRIDSWLRNIKEDFIRNKVSEGDFDKLADRIRNLDLGEGKVAVNGGFSMSPVVSELRNLYKEKAGRVYSLDQIKGLQSNIDHYKYITEKETEEHLPQTRETSTDYSKESAKADKGKSKAYWDTEREKFARAFDAFVTDTIEENAAKNTYLSGLEAIPPKGEERTTINQAFKDLVQEIKTRETDKGVEMYSTRDIDNQANQEYTNTKGEQDERQADDMREGRGRNDLESEVSKERERRVGIARQRILDNQNSPPRLRAAIAEGKEKGLIYYPEGAKSKEYQEVLAFAKSNGIIDVIPVIDTSGQIDGFIRDGIMFINMNTDDVPLLQTAKHEISHFLGNQETQDKINKDSQAFRKYWMVLSRAFGRSLSKEFVAEEYAAELESGAITRHGINLKEGLKTGETVTAIQEGRETSAVSEEAPLQEVAEQTATYPNGNPVSTKITNPSTIARLETGKKIKAYRAMQIIDGKLYPPMSASIGGKLRTPTEIGAWEQAAEMPELADDKGHFKLEKGNKKTIKARYNPDFHTSRSPLNDQFAEAYNRPNLVTVEVEVPESELASGYKADKAKDSVGEVAWHSGPVSSKLPADKSRKVILSRYAKVVRVVPDSEVAEHIAELLSGEDISIPDNVVTPSLKSELIKRGVNIVKSGKVEDVKFSRTPETSLITEARKYKTAEEFVAAQGEPLYHATRQDFDTYNPDKTISGLGIHFGTKEQANKAFDTMGTSENVNGKQPMAGRRINQDYVSLKNPLRMKDDGTWYSFNVIEKLEKLGIKDRTPLPQNAKDLAGYDLPHQETTWRNKSDARKIYDVKTKQHMNEWRKSNPEATRKEYESENIRYGNEYVRNLIKENGYDGIVYKNEYEGSGDSFIAFNADQIKTKADLTSIWNKAQEGKGKYSIRKQTDPPVSSDPKVLNLYLKDETDAIVQTIINKLHPKSMSWLETMLKSPEWFDHPQIQNIVKLFMRDRNEIYHETFNELNAFKDSTVTEAAKTLRNKGLTLADRLSGKVSPEYQTLMDMIDDGDTRWVRNKKIPLETQLQHFEDAWRKKGATDEIMNVWRSFRQSYDKALDLMTKQLRDMIEEIKQEAKAKGERPDLSELNQTLRGALAQMEEWRGFYAPRQRQGNWAVQAYKEHGPLEQNREWYRAHHGSELSARREAKRLERDGWKIYKVGEVEKLPEDIYQDVRAVSTAKLIDTALGKLGKKSDMDITTFNEEVLREVSNMIKSRGFRSTMIHRGSGNVVRGFIEDPIERHLMYINSVSGGISKARVARMAMNELLGDKVDGSQIGGIDPAKDPKAFTVAQNYIQEQLRNADKSDRIIGLAKSIATFKFLGFNLRSLAVNTTAILTTAPAAIHQYATGGKGSFAEIFRELAKAGKDYGAVMAGKDLGNPDEAAFIADVHKKGWDDAQYTREALGEMSKLHNKAWSAAMDASMWAFGKSEQWNRGTTMLAAYRVARKQGLNHAEAADRAKTSSDKAHGVYGKSTMPMWAQGTNPAAKIGQMMYVYSKFGHNYLQMLYDMGFKQHNVKGAMFAFLSPLVLAGGAALPFKDAIFGAAGIILGMLGYDDDPEKWVWDEIREHLGGEAEKIGRHGLTGAAGVDISGSLSIGIGVPKNFIDLTGAIGGVAAEIKEAGENIGRGKYARAAEHLLPTGFANPIRAMRESSEGVTTRNNRRVWDEKGRPYVPDSGASLARAFGFRSTDQAVLSERTWEGHRQQTAFSEKRNSIYERYRSWILGGRDREEYKNIVNEVQEFNGYIRRNKIKGEAFITSQSLKNQVRRMQRPSRKERSILEE